MDAPIEVERGVIPLRVVVVTAVRLVREGLARILRNEGAIAMVEPASVLQATSLMATSRPHVVAAESAIVRRTDLAARAAEAGTPLVAFGVPEEDEDEVLGCAEAGVGGMVASDATVEEFVDVLRAAATGEVRCSPRVTALLIRRVVTLASFSRTREGKVSNLTRREREIAAFIERGLSNKEIVSELGIEIATVKNHVHSLLEKLQVRRRGEVPLALRTKGHAPGAAAVPFLPLVRVSRRI
jgi:two-component system nitrate/nitrite response regulator NarL